MAKYKNRFEKVEHIFVIQFDQFHIYLWEDAHSRRCFFSIFFFALSKRIETHQITQFLLHHSFSRFSVFVFRSTFSVVLLTSHFWLSGVCVRMHQMKWKYPLEIITHTNRFYSWKQKWLRIHLRIRWEKGARTKCQITANVRESSDYNIYVMFLFAFRYPHSASNRPSARTLFNLYKLHRYVPTQFAK